MPYFFMFLPATLEECARVYYGPHFSGDGTETKKVKYSVNKTANLQSYLQIKQENNLVCLASGTC